MTWEIALASVVRALNVFEKLNLDRRIDRVRIDSALQTLRQIFFYSSELTRALEDIEGGRAIEPEVVEYFINDFQVMPVRVRDALEFIENEQFEDRNALLIEDIEQMNQIRYMKADTRRQISDFFQEYQKELERGSNRISLDASRILGQIERLNTLIKKLEAKLLAAHHGDTPASVRRPATRARTRRD